MKTTAYQTTTATAITMRDSIKMASIENNISQSLTTTGKLNRKWRPLSANKGIFSSLQKKTFHHKSIATVHI